MTRTKLLSILQEETDGFKEQSRLRDDVLDAMEQAYIKGKKEQLTLTNVVVPKGTCCLKPKKIGKVNDMFESWDECKNCGKEML